MSHTSTDTASPSYLPANGAKGALNYLGEDEIHEGRPVHPVGEIQTRQPRAAPLITVEPLKRSEMQPSYAQDMGSDAISNSFYGSMIDCLGGIMGGLGSIPCCIICPNPYLRVDQGQVGLLTKFGQFYKSVDPGLVKVNPLSEKLQRVDIRITVLSIPRQNVITRDNVAVDVECVLYYNIVNPFKATFGIANVKQALVERAQTTLRHVVGARNLQNLLTDREAVAAEIEQIVEGVSRDWGVKIESLLLKDIVFSQELQQSLSSAAQAKRVGESKVIAARAEVDAAKLMREAADILSSPAAIQIRQLEALQAMARTSDAKTIFVPMSLMSNDGLTNTATLQQLANS